MRGAVVRLEGTGGGGGQVSWDHGSLLLVRGKSGVSRGWVEKDRPGVHSTPRRTGRRGPQGQSFKDYKEFRE